MLQACFLWVSSSRAIVLASVLTVALLPGCSSAPSSPSPAPAPDPPTNPVPGPDPPTNPAPNPPPASGTVVLDGNVASGQGRVHLNPNPNRVSWEGHPQVDDRPGQSFVVDQACTLDRVSVRMGRDEDETAGAALVRLYAHEGPYGTGSQPANAAVAEDTPTRGWLAESEGLTLTAASMPVAPDWYDFRFTGSGRLPLQPGRYVFVVDWRPTGPDQGFFNNVFVSVDVSRAHAGNAYIDGNSPNHGVRSDFDLIFQVYGVC